MTALDRRTALALMGSATAALAGCSERVNDLAESDTGRSDGDDDARPAPPLDDSLPSYASVLPETDGSEYFYGAIDVETMASLLEESDAEGGDEPTDPLLGNPIVIALYCSYALTLLGNSPSFEAYRANGDETQGAETFVFADGVYAFAAAYDLDGFVSDLDAADAYEQERLEDAYGVYSDPESGEVVGVAAATFALSYPNENDPDFDPVTAVERTVATAAGDRDPKHDTDDGFERLLRAGAADGITLGLHTSDNEFDPATLESAADDTNQLTFAFDAFGGSNGIHQQLSVAGDDAAARAVVTYADADRLDLDRLESALGTDADGLETAVVRDGTTVVIDAEYTGNLVED